MRRFSVSFGWQAKRTVVLQFGRSSRSSAPGSRRAFGALRARTARTCAGGTLGLACKRATRCRFVRLVPQGAAHRAGAGRGGLRGSSPLSFAVIACRLLARARAGSSFRRRRELHSGPTRFREANGNGLLGRPCAVLPLANVMYFFADELPGLCARRFPLTCISTRAFDRLFLRHLFRSPISGRCIKRTPRDLFGSN